MKVAGLAVWGAAQRRAKLTDEQVPLSLSTLALALPPEQGTIGLDTHPSDRMKAYTWRMEVDRVYAVYGVDTGGQGWTE